MNTKVVVSNSFLFSPLLGEMIPNLMSKYFSKGLNMLKPPTRYESSLKLDESE